MTSVPTMPATAAARLLEDFSLEMTGKDIRKLEETRDTIPRGTRINVTFLHNEDLPMRLAAAKAIRESGFVPVPHISARRLHSAAMLEEFLAALQADGTVENVFVVGGDPPRPHGPYEDSLTVMQSGLLERYGVRHVSVSGYPEGHPAIPDQALWSALEDKAAALGARAVRRGHERVHRPEVRLLADWPDGHRGAGPVHPGAGAGLRPAAARPGQAALLHVRRPAGHVGVDRRLPGGSGGSSPRPAERPGGFAVTMTQEVAARGATTALAQDLASLIVYGQDRTGIVAAVGSVLTRHGANIVSLDQYSDNPHGGAFFQRTVFSLDHLKAVLPEIRKDLGAALAKGFRLEFRLRDMSVPKRVAIFASKSDHCLLDLLWRHRRGDLLLNVAMVISNHADTAEEVRSFGIPFFHVPSMGPDKSAAEAEHLRLLQGNVDFVVLARYMQILSGAFIAQAGVPIINIHHSFLPAFIGAGPYAKAKERGVKLIGATAHYVTEDLDEGPIIEQDVVRVTHADTVADLQRRGADVERTVLSRAVQWHSEDRVIRSGNHTIVFA
jgi:formyltetrahydrofolate deformylase